VPIDSSDQADGPDDAHMAPPDSSPARPDSALRTKGTVEFRAEVNAIYRQHASDHGRARVADVVPDSINESGWVRQRLFNASRAELALFRTERAGLPETGPEEADRYIEQHRTGRPWLEAAERASPESRRIIAAIDQGTGHGHIRHEGWVTEEANMRRAAFLEDPAQLDMAKRLCGIDGLKPNDKRHKCADLATRITDPDTFATAFARGVEHPRVRAALATPYDPGVWPKPVLIPIADLLGKDGHKHCTGWQLEPVSGSMDAAISNRRAWRTAIAEARQPDVLRPTARPVPTFEGGTLIFIMGHNEAWDGYQIVNMYPQPRDAGPPAS
jgi:hypothetical protein